jgi:hypothetical protein
MRELFRWRRVVGLIGGSLVLSLLGCQSPGSQRIVGPDGSPMTHVHCGADQGLCFRMAGELCPGGYEMKPVLRSSDGNFLVRCRAGNAPAVAAACAPATSPVTPGTTAGVTTRPSGLMDPWPPAAEPASAAYPWPSPQTSAGGRSQPKAPAATGDVDVGY